MEPRARIGRNLDTCKRALPLIKLMDYEHREDAVGGANNGKYTHTHTHNVSIVIHRMDGASVKDRTQLDTCKRGPLLIKLMSYELRKDAVGGGGGRKWQTHTCTHTHTVSFVIHRVDGASERIGRNLDNGRRGLPPN